MVRWKRERVGRVSKLITFLRPSLQCPPPRTVFLLDVKLGGRAQVALDAVLGRGEGEELVDRLRHLLHAGRDRVWETKDGERHMSLYNKHIDKRTHELKN